MVQGVMLSDEVANYVQLVEEMKASLGRLVAVRQELAGDAPRRSIKRNYLSLSAVDQEV